MFEYEKHELENLRRRLCEAMDADNVIDLGMDVSNIKHYEELLNIVQNGFLKLKEKHKKL